MMPALNNMSAPRPEEGWSFCTLPGSSQVIAKDSCSLNGLSFKIALQPALNFAQSVWTWRCTPCCRPLQAGHPPTSPHSFFFFLQDFLQVWGYRADVLIRPSVCFMHLCAFSLLFLFCGWMTKTSIHSGHSQLLYLLHGGRLQGLIVMVTHYANEL